VWRLLEPYSRTYISLTVPGADRRRIAGLHTPVLDALRARDAVAAEAAIRHHFADARDMLAGLWTEPEPDETDQPPARAPRARTGPVPAPATTSERTR
jgi:DNA-binding GntR family transcriptional regulator